ncbi:Uncharacterised protein [Moraxella lacunata]|uniref:DUF4194 domain-containing protein n=2 Tax=Moraxella lacunata TaxID=477 RepID=A0A378QEF7_MORLA|nr:DUF4194 domain-containing protein [Moraxella lacunata]STY98870.1 Uncharacterised protein [Moraxella lacunata]
MDTQFLYDTNQTLKNAIQDLLKHGYIEKHQKPNIYQQLFGNIDFINAYLSIMDLSMHIDDIRGVIYVGVYQKIYDIIIDDTTNHETHDENNHDDNPTNNSHSPIPSYDKMWSHPFIRRQRLTLHQSLLIAILRQKFVEIESQSGVGTNTVWVDFDDLKNQYFSYINHSGSEKSDDDSLKRLLSQLKDYGIIGDMDEQGKIIIRPLIAHLANPENLGQFLMQLKNLNGAYDE